MGETYAVEMRDITKVFPGIIANDNITLTLRKGEIHALLGENGAGKSTLMSVLFGLYKPEKGKIFRNGREISIKGPNDANNYGIGMVHQHFKLVQCFSVLDNIILGAEPNFHGILNKAEARKKINEISEKYGLKVDLDAKCEDISVGMQQRTEILKMLYRNNDVLIFDEPTAVLTPEEIDELIVIIKGLAAEGRSILFISHKLNEIMAAADRCTVLRRGKYAGTVDIADTSKEELSRMMVGRDVALTVEKTAAHPGDVIFEAKDYSVTMDRHGKKAVRNISFSVRAGEIVCIAGIDGNGQTELVYGLSGIAAAEEGTLTLKGKNISKCSVRERSLSVMGNIPEDRHKHGLILDYDLGYNLVLKRYYENGFSDKAGFLRPKNIRKYADKLISEYDIRSGQGAATIARSMSGGNQQKAVIAREIDRDPDLLIAVQPTRGLDVGAIEFIHKRLIRHRDEGHAVLLVSLELEEVLSVSDRILVMFEGEIVGELDPKNTTREELGLYMSGAKRDSEGGAA